MQLGGKFMVARCDATEWARRSVLSDLTMPLLAEIGQRRDTIWVLDLQHPPTSDGLLFHTSTEMPFWHEYYTQKVFAPAVVKAALPTDTTTHELRHHYASVLLAAGESVIAVAERLGHEDTTLVLTTYGHLLPGSEDRTRRAVDAAWNAASEPSGEAATAQDGPDDLHRSSVAAQSTFYGGAQ